MIHLRISFFAIITSDITPTTGDAMLPNEAEVLECFHGELGLVPRVRLSDAT